MKILRTTGLAISFALIALVGFHIYIFFGAGPDGVKAVNAFGHSCNRTVDAVEFISRSGSEIVIMDGLTMEQAEIVVERVQRLRAQGVPFALIDLTPSCRSENAGKFVAPQELPQA